MTHESLPLVVADIFIKVFYQGFFHQGFTKSVFKEFAFGVKPYPILPGHTL